MNVLSRAPRIGITMDHETTASYSRYPWYALRENYCSSIAQSGGVPLPIPHERALVETYLDMIDGLVITGGNFDVSPALYGQEVVSDTVSMKDNRTLCEYALVQGALARSMPILGICGGQQLLNVVLGGTLIQHIPDAIAQPLAHEQPNPRHEAGHVVSFVEDSMLARIAGCAQTSVNSAHHQAVDVVAPKVRVNAYAPDGVIEGIELPDHPFCLGVQWHPEFFISEVDHKLYTAFIEAAKIYAGNVG
ncbi:MAG: gamma-glutamyl-gamma-aminobutyrate hydrolase family protein [Alphaproteobacteria bacterium]|nr:MAG: gamma-glutamyl-gamma-aminobutyrate hydrolase family protein [Alphaproteobacteria bacterium]TAF75872.1 MAG: gamma-glutamyl-gamma-aminobutyrate hydrolase family protein [Alphaproteobacteria bacterium]